MDVIRTAVTVGRVMPVLAAAGLAAASVGAYALQPDARRSKAAPFAVRVDALRRTIRPGGKVRFRILIRRRAYRGRVTLTAERLPRGLRATKPVRASRRMPARVRLKVTRDRSHLDVWAARTLRGGSYHFIVRGRGGRFTTALRLTVTVAARRRPPPPPGGEPFSIAGGVTGLAPGAPQPLDLSLTNPNPVAISVTGLRVSVQRVNAPEATLALPCSTADFAVAQFSGSFPVTVPAHTTLRLSGGGLAPARWPQLTLVNRPVNQDGCQRATVTLVYDGTARSQ